MAIDSRKLIEAIQDGLPICAHPYAEIARQLECSEAEILGGIADLEAKDVLKRFGVVVKHRRLGYHANAMVVWNIADELVDAVGTRLAAEPSVTLCYQRPRQLPDWPYNLFTMVHGKERDAVLDVLTDIRERLAIAADHEVLFSTKCFKQRGARYF